MVQYSHFSKTATYIYTCVYSFLIMFTLDMESHFSDLRSLGMRIEELSTTDLHLDGICRYSGPSHILPSDIRNT